MGDFEVLDQDQLLKFLRSRQELAWPVEQGLRDALNNTPSNPTTANIRNWKWDNATQTGQGYPTTVLAFGTAKYYKDHIIERQYIAAIVIRRIRENERPMDGRERHTFENIVWRFMINVFNAPFNLCCLDEDSHQDKTNFFNVAKVNAPMTQRVRDYLNFCRPGVLGGLAQVLANKDPNDENGLLGLETALENDNAINNHVLNAIIDVCKKVITDLGGSPWADAQSAGIWQIGTFWGIDYPPFP